MRRASTCSQRLARVSASVARLEKVSINGRSSGGSSLRKLPIRRRPRKGKTMMLKRRTNGNLITRQIVLMKLRIFVGVGFSGVDGRFCGGSRTRDRLVLTRIDDAAQVFFGLHHFHVGLPHQIARQI